MIYKGKTSRNKSKDTRNKQSIDFDKAEKRSTGDSRKIKTKRTRLVGANFVVISW